MAFSLFISCYVTVAQSLVWLGEMKLYIVAAAIALVSIPFVISRLDE